MSLQGRIWFEDNPWPGGHAIKALEFSLLLDEQGLGLLLELQSDDYYAEDPTYWDEIGNEEEEEEDDAGDWGAKIVWGNYHSCRLSNTYWGIGEETVPRIDLRGALFDAALPEPLHFSVDPVAFGEESPKQYDDHAFHIYLTGHDAVASHDIVIERQENGLFSLRWSGLIALAYIGQNDFKHRFRAEARDVAFRGFQICKDEPSSAASSPAKARGLASRFIKGADQLRFEEGTGAHPDLLRP